MIPQVARHYSMPQFGGVTGYAVPPSESQSQPRRTERPALLPFRSSRTLNSSSTLSSPHRAYPVESNEYQRSVAAGGSSSDQGFGDQHMLRRKTPNGTLAAGYDGTSVQWSSKPPALKHVLLAGPEASTLSDGSTGTAFGWSHNFGDHEQQVNNIPGNWTSFPQAPYNLRNPLDQVSPMHQPATYFQPHTFQVPTNLQPTYQIGPGPTASNDGGFYGPYWPDGNYVPYRPAALANHGYEHGSHDFKFQGGPQSFRQPEATNFDPGSIPFARMHDTTRLYDSTQQSLYQLPGSSSSVFHDNSHSPAYQSLTRAGNAQFKEKTLSWAHGIYVDLLTHLHHAKRESRSNRSRTQAKNVIYPKPPKQASSKFSSPSRATHVSNDNYDFQGDINPNYGGMRLTNGSHSGLRSSYSFTEPSETRYARPSSQDIPHYVPPFPITQNSNASPTTKAAEALELLTNLCEQSGWRWVDGMLLGGCLAYGLEDYQKALQWYSKIIVLDPKHVEAISNVAATFLCLDKRDEAERYWLQSVKLRPSYFEAVEHLVGLLCGDHRGNEAVSIIEYVERSLRLPGSDEAYYSESSSSGEPYPPRATSDRAPIDYVDGRLEPSSALAHGLEESAQSGFGSSGFAIPGSENGRMLALVHAKGNMLYSLGNVNGAAKAFEDAVIISAGKAVGGIEGLVRKIIQNLTLDCFPELASSHSPIPPASPLLLPPDKALQTAKVVFATTGNLPGLLHVPDGLARKSAISTTSNSLLSLAKIFQDAMSNSTSQRISRVPAGVGDILALYYLSLSLQPSPSTANNVGILLAGVQQPTFHRPIPSPETAPLPQIPGVVLGSGVALALAYYNYGLNLDARHAHLYTNLGSLLKDIGQLNSAIRMYEHAVQCDSTFDIALANLANAVKDQGRTSDAIEYYKKAVKASPDFAEAVCGLSNALNSVCDWKGRGGVVLDGGKLDHWHVDDRGIVTEVVNAGGLMKRVVDIVAKQLREGSSWGCGTLQGVAFQQLLQQLEFADCGGTWPREKKESIQATLNSWAGHRWEGARVVRMIERAIKRATHRWYHDRYTRGKFLPPSNYSRPQFPSSLSVPSAPTVLPFHTFTCPLTAKEIRMISQRNALRISCSTLRSPWMQGSVFPPPAPPAPHLNVGYVSSDFNNHPLAHLMQSVFGLHNPSRAKAFCYATTVSDNSSHRQQIEREAPVFRDVSSWSAERLVNQIVQDGIHILVNLNGYTRGARNEVFAARPAPIQMSYMGFAGTLGAEWCDYLLLDETAVPPETLRPWRRNVDLEDQIEDEEAAENEDWVYSENIIFCQDSFFCCDHAQSEPREHALSWDEEQTRRWQMRKELFPSLSDDAIILGNFNQLYKIEPTTFRSWLRILEKVPKAILWLLRFPDLGESNLKRTAQQWAGENVASRIWFTDVAQKHQHISRARVCDLFLDTPECNAHTTAADVLWSSTPLLTLPRYQYKLCSRMAASILKGALPKNKEGREAASELIAKNDDQYEEFAIRLARNFRYEIRDGYGHGVGRLGELRKLLYESRWSCALFDTQRWVRDLEVGYEEAWRRWVADEGGDIYIDGDSDSDEWESS